MLKIKLFGWGTGYLYCEVADIHHIEPPRTGYSGATIFLRDMPADHPGYSIPDEELSAIEPFLLGTQPDIEAAYQEGRAQGLSKGRYVSQQLIDAYREYMKVLSYTGIPADAINRLLDKVLMAVADCMPPEQEVED